MFVPENHVALNFMGNILCIPKEDLSCPNRMRWWMNADCFGYDPRLEEISLLGWNKYKAYTTGILHPLQPPQSAQKGFISIVRKIMQNVIACLSCKKY